MAQEIRGLTDQELHQKMDQLKKDLMNLRFQLALKQLDNTNKIKNVKRDIARIWTILTERELASADNTAKASDKAEGNRVRKGG